MTLFLLFITGMFAGTVDAIAGGGGLISLPMLLSIGMPPHIAFGTNKLQGTIGTFMAVLKYYRHGYISLKKVYKGVLWGVAGSILGAVASQLMSSEFLHKIIPLLLCAIFVYTVCSPKLGHQDREARLGESIFYLLFGFALAFYDGFFGPGTGSFWVFALTFFLGYNLIKATAYTKVFNLNSSFIATLCFAAGGNIDYRFAIAMALGQIIGGRLGAHLAITKGARLIRPVFLGVVSLTIASLVYKNYANAQMITALSRHANLALPVLAVAVLLASMLIGYFRLIKREKSQTPG
ncbi:hypothetical protein AQUSIP_09580 [Aquicella siphonis]|uniref:Probable membrane transporter protein n=1 Tax=Aquicella siphonis TaxID=254247 RepID=A0A5E4PGL8_9COXI|nr:TSUP family transporter [Aquicella siphonis]VVC75668.1 hypothetical protein AQUSIP_09580 [Aquicella siphonis]